MSTDSGPPRSVPIGSLVLLAIAGCLYLALMYTVVSSGWGGAEGSLEQALRTVFLTVFLWAVLAILLLVGGVMGEMPRGAAIAALVLTPLSAVASITGTDLYSHVGEWAIVIPGLLPVLIAGYAMWARLPALHATFPPQNTSLAVWGAVLVLSLASFGIASW